MKIETRHRRNYLQICPVDIDDEKFCSRSLHDLFADGFRERAILQERITVYTQAHRSK
jgi:hypothetical protein